LRLTASIDKRSYDKTEVGETPEAITVVTSSNTTDLPKMISLIYSIMEKSGCNIWSDSATISQIMEILHNNLTGTGNEVKKKEIESRFITDINVTNIYYCKGLRKYSQVRHLDGKEGFFMINLGEYICNSLVNIKRPNNGLSQELVYSNIRPIAQMRAIPAEQRN
jgi:hypothetical protein